MIHFLRRHEIDAEKLNLNHWSLKTCDVGDNLHDKTPFSFVPVTFSSIQAYDWIFVSKSKELSLLLPF